MRRPHLGQLSQEAIVARDALAVGVDHDEGDAAVLGRPDEVDDLRMDGRLAAGELHHLRVALGAHEVIEHLLPLLPG